MGLVDSGASRSMIRRDVWEELCQKGVADGHLTTGVRLRSLTGHLLEVEGVATIRLYGRLCGFHVMRHLQHQVLIGTDVMEICTAALSYEDRQVVLCGRLHAWVGEEKMTAAAGVVSEPDYWRSQFPAVFPQKGTPLRATQVVEMSIDTGDAHPIRQRAYRIPLAKMKTVEQELEKMLDDGIIEPSTSAWASPLTLVPKKDGSIRFCVDYRRLNEVTKKDAYPLPRIQDIFDQLDGAKIFTTIDLKCGYWQIRMAPDSIEKTAVVTHRGLFQFKRMQFGLTNAPAVFQRMMNSVLAALLGKCCLIYLDDIVVYSRDEESHHAHVKQVLQKLQEHGLAIKESKCHFGLAEVKLLGYVVCAEGLKADPDKVSAITDMAAPTDKKGVRRLLGSANYYRQLMPNYALVVAPIVALTKKNAKFKWGIACERAWSDLKQLLLECVVLKFPSPNKPYKLYTDASDYSLGAILVQQDEAGIDRPVHLLSARFNPAQRNYPTIEKEAYALIYALVKLRPYLYGAQFTIFTDHKPLKCLFMKELRNSRIQRWAVLMAEYAAPIEYMKGNDNVWADMLSRLRADTGAEEPPEMSSVEMALMEEDIPFEYYNIDKAAVKMGTSAFDFALGKAERDNYRLIDGLLYSLVAGKGERVYPRLVLPKGERKKVIEQAHNDVGHMGMSKTLNRVHEHFRWPGMAADVYEFVNRCAPCMTNRTRRERPSPTKMPLPVAPGMFVAADLTGPFPVSSEGNRYLLSIMDHCTGWVEAKALPNKAAEGIFQFIFREYIPRFSAPEVFLTDNGLEFKNKLLMGHLKALGVDVRHTTPYHPQSNGMIERYHRTIKNMFRRLVNSRANNWETYLGDVLLVMRTVVSDVTGFSPFYLTYGRHPNRPHMQLYKTLMGSVGSEAAHRVDELSTALKEAVRNREISRQYNFRRAYAKANAEKLCPGDQVMLHVNEPGALDRKYDPGYIITRVWGSVITCVGPDNLRRTVNRDQVCKVHSQVKWDDIRPRLSRTQRRERERRAVRERDQLNEIRRVRNAEAAKWDTDALANDDWEEGLQGTPTSSRHKSRPHNGKVKFKFKIDRSVTSPRHTPTPKYKCSRSLVYAPGVFDASRGFEVGGHTLRPRKTADGTTRPSMNPGGQPLITADASDIAMDTPLEDVGPLPMDLGITGGGDHDPIKEPQLIQVRLQQRGCGAVGKHRTPNPPITNIWEEPEGDRAITYTGQQRDKRAHPTDDVTTTRVLRSHTRAGWNIREREQTSGLVPDKLTQQEEKRACIAAVNTSGNTTTVY